MIAILDYGVGNLASIQNMFRKIRLESDLVSDPNQLRNYEKIILPGIGHFDHAMNQFKKSNMLPALEDLVLKQSMPLLGICVGAQMLGVGSEEGSEKGLGWLNIETKRFPDELNVRVPHMQWNEVSFTKDELSLFEDVPVVNRFYFVHSYYLICNDPSIRQATSYYGKKFVSAFEKGNLAGVQFHPEKSLNYGMKLLGSFGKK